jgi:aminoglycoside phosphotransferase (APT) family kinase protein
MEATGRAGMVEMYWLEPEASWLDRPFCMMARIDECEANPTNVLMGPAYFPVRAKIAAQFTDILAKIHHVDWRALGLDFLRAPASEDACGLREIEEWEAVLDREATGVARLPRGRPKPRRRLCWCTRTTAPATSSRILPGRSGGSWTGR